MSDAVTTRLNKWISETGICSRREADKLIEQGRVKLNDVVAETGMKVAAGDRVAVDGKLLTSKPARVYLAYHKPVGITCTTERAVVGNITDAVNYPQRIFPIGRLDKPSEGLILLTNDGDIVNKILRAGNEHEKEYIVTLAERFDDKFLQQMRAGVPILDTVTKPCTAERLSARTFRIILTQGLNRQIRRMAEYLGHQVVTLKRVRIMSITLGDLPVGSWRELNKRELSQLETTLVHSVKTEEASRSATSERRLRQQPAKKSGRRQQKSERGRDATKDGAAKTQRPRKFRPRQL